MATKLVVRAGQAHGVYDDRWRAILEALGPMQVTRASEVEYEPGTGDWVATLPGTTTEIARGRNRGAVIAAEVAYLEGRL